MLSASQISESVRRIVSAAQPRKVILFGSYARGDAREDSDLDLLVVERDIVSRGEEMARLRGLIGAIGVGVDVLVCSEEEAEKKRDWCTSPIYWAFREGKVLYDAGHR